MGRDHATECEHCGALYGGFNGPDRCWHCAPDAPKTELIELRRIGDKLQSEASRAVEGLTRGVDLSELPYETMTDPLRDLAALSVDPDAMDRDSEVDMWGFERVSACCGASVHVEDGMPDFVGDKGCVTCWMVCDGCGQACDVKREEGQ